MPNLLDFMYSEDKFYAGTKAVTGFTVPCACARIVLPPCLWSVNAQLTRFSGDLHKTKHMTPVKPLMFPSIDRALAP